MKESATANTELEQALYTSSQREQQARSRAALSFLAPLLVGAFWLVYSGYEVTALKSRVRKLEDQAAAQEQTEAGLKAQAAQADASRSATEKNAASIKKAETSAREQISALKQTLVSLRGELDNMELAVGELTAVRSKLAALNNSEPVEAQITGVRNSLNRGFASIEKQLDQALPDVERKPVAHIFITDDDQRATAEQLKAQLENSGFEVAGVTKNTTRKLDATEVRYFRNPRDKTEAQKIETILEKQLGKTDARVSYTDDAASAAGGRKFQVWLKKSALR